MNMIPRKPLTPVAECKEGHCAFHFPQFKRATFSDLKSALNRATSDAAASDSYFRQRYTNWEQETVCYYAAYEALVKDRDLLACCEVLNAMEGSCFVSYQFYLTTHGEPCVFQPCCR